MLEIAENTIARALGQPKMVQTDLPRAGRATLRHAAKTGADILHLLHATPALRGTLGNQPIQPIQDLVTLHNCQINMAARGTVTSVRTVPDDIPLIFSQSDGRVSFAVPAVRGHQMVEVKYRG